MWPFKHSCKWRLIGIHFGRETNYGYMTMTHMFWMYECKCRGFIISSLFGAEICGELPKCLDSVGDRGKIRYMKRFLPKADRG